MPTRLTWNDLLIENLSPAEIGVWQHIRAQHFLSAG
jgi:hypothetical protein